MGVYAACFLLIAVLNAQQANHDGYTGRVAYLLDGGNQHSGHVLSSHEYLSRHVFEFSRVGTLEFSNDHEYRALQIADVIAWSARRRRAEGLTNGFEPLEQIFAQDHADQPFEEKWMAEIAESIRRKRRVTPQLT
jgi:hypothetical protein